MIALFVFPGKSVRMPSQSLYLVVCAAALIVAQSVSANPMADEAQVLSPNFTRGVTFDQMVAREEARRGALAQGGYQKQTEFDNTPYRFNMKPGEKMSAEQFDAWMESRGIRIVRAKAEPAASAVAAGTVSE